MAQTIDPESRICIVGAGPAGICAAIEYQKAGFHNVLLLEQRDQVGGRCVTTPQGTDMGAIVWVPDYHSDIIELSNELGIKRNWVPPVSRMKINPEVNSFPSGALHNALAYIEAIRYMLAWYQWKGVCEASPGEVSEILMQPWSTFVRVQGYERFAGHVSESVIGYGYRDLPAVYIARAITPRAILGSVKAKLLGGESLGNWHGGVAQIWQRLVKKYNLQVRLNTPIEKIQRGAGVNVQLNGESLPLEFDYLVIACNPATLVDVLDVSQVERELFSQIETFDYRTYECRVPGFQTGKAFYGSLIDNHVDSGINRPVILYKRDPHSDLFVVYVNADGASDEAIIENIRADFIALGAVLEEVTCREKFEYSPHVRTQALQNNHYVELARLQGERHTLGVGAAYTFDNLPNVVRQTRNIIRQHIAGEYLQRSEENL